MPERKESSLKKERTIREEILDELLTDYKNPEDLIGKDGIFDELKKRLLERVLDGELTDHLGYRKQECFRESMLRKCRPSLRQTNARI